MKRANKIVPYIRVGTKEQAEEYARYYESLNTPRLEEIREYIRQYQKNKRR